MTNIFSVKTPISKDPLPASDSEFRISMRVFLKNKIAVVCVVLLGLLYFSAIFADFLSPYSFKTENRQYSYSSPTKVHIFDQGKLTRPFVYGIKLTFNEYHKRIYQEDRSKKYPIQFFVKGDQYKLFYLIPLRTHLWGVPEEGQIYLLGADSRGRDLFSRILYGGRVSLFIGLIGVTISFSIGLLVGGISGYYGGKVDNILMRSAEMVMMVPGFYLLLALMAVVPPDWNPVQRFFAMTFVLSFIGWAGLARIIRGMCLSLREREFVLAAKSIGLSDIKIIIKHILPHTLSYSIFAVMLSIPGYILGESALSLIGLGIQDPYASWGNLLTDAMSIVRIKFYPWILIPAFFIFLTVICFNVVGDALRDALDPMLKSEGDRA